MAQLWAYRGTLPTVAASGVPGYVAVIHYGMVAPAGLSRALAERLNAELRAALGTEDVRARIVDEGGEPLPGTRGAAASELQRRYTTRYESGR